MSLLYSSLLRVDVSHRALELFSLSDMLGTAPRALEENHNGEGET